MTDIGINQAHLIEFVLVDAAGTEVTGLAGTFTVQVSKNGAAFAASTGVKAEIGSGWYSYTLTAAETNTAGPLAVIITGTGAVQQNLLYTVSGFAVTAQSGQSYCTVAQLKARLGITDTADDAVLAQIIEGVSAEIDNDTHRRFWTTVADEDRYYTAANGGQVFIDDDLISITALATDDAGTRTYSTTWLATDYELWPLNAALRGRPYSWVEVVPNGRLAFPTTRRGVKITGKFGYSTTVPPVVREACLLQSERLFKRKDAPFGVMGSPDTGYVRLKDELDPDVSRLLDSVRKAQL